MLLVGCGAGNQADDSSGGGNDSDPVDSGDDVGGDDTGTDTGGSGAAPVLEVSNYSGIGIVRAHAIGPDGTRSDPLGGAGLADKETVTWELAAGEWSLYALDATDACAALEGVNLVVDKVYYWKIDSLPDDCSGLGK